MVSTSSRKVLNSKGSRVTRQRLLLLDMVRQGGQHLDADELFRRAKAKLPRLSLSTVYRSLRYFKETGLVEELHFDEEHHHYEGKPLREHYHLVCLGCGKVLEFQSPLVARLAQEVEKKEGFQVTRPEVRLAGLCADCQRKEEG